MHLRLVAVVALVAAALVVPTAAMTTDGEDDVDSLVGLSPHDGSNGEYATVANGELRVDFEGLNDEARTTAHDVFTVTSRADEPIEVWVEADVDGSVLAYEGDDPDADLDREDARTLQPGETIGVGFAIDTAGEDPESGTVTVGVRDPDDGSSGGDSGGGSGSSGAGTGGGSGSGGAGAGSSGGSGSGSDGDAATPTATPRETPTGGPDLVDRSVGVEVVFEGEGAYEDTVVRELDSLPADGPGTDPLAAIDPGRLLSTVDDDGLSVHGTRFVARQHEPLRLTGSQSYVSTADSVAREPRPAAIVEITPPPALRDDPATVRIRVAREGFPATDPEVARIGRHTPEGWQVLPTRVVDGDEETVLLEARTQGFSVFTVFAESDVAYEWTLPDGETVPGNDLRTSFADAGPRNVTLTVTDAFGRSDEAHQEILVNDEPSVTVEQHRNGSDGGSTTLRANVTDEYGNATVTWTLPDGSTATGEAVTGAFEAGETIEVVVEDEYGATATERTTVGAGPGQAGLTQFPLGLPLWAWALLALAAVGTAAVLAGWGLPGRVGAGVAEVGRAAVAALADDSPRIRRFEDPRWNPAADRVEISRLEVVAPGGTLGAVEIAVIDDAGRTVLTRTVDTGTTDSYAASPEHVPVYGGLELDGGGYSVEVRAVDDRDRVARDPQRQRRPVGVVT